MGIFDKAKDLVAEHADKVGQGIDKLGDVVDQRTGGQHAARVDRAQDEAKRRVEDLRAGKQGPADPVPPTRT